MPFSTGDPHEQELFCVLRKLSRTLIRMTPPGAIAAKKPYGRLCEKRYEGRSRRAEVDMRVGRSVYIVCFF